MVDYQLKGLKGRTNRFYKCVCLNNFRISLIFSPLLIYKFYYYSRCIFYLRKFYDLYLYTLRVITNFFYLK